MPPTFLYLLAFAAWLCLAFLVWLTAAFLLILPMTRRFAGPLASAMACTFPTVIIFQLAALPFAAIIMGVALLAMRLVDPTNSPETTNPTVIGIGLILIAAEFTVFGGMSLLGFFEGWRAGWLAAKGHGLRNVISRGVSARLIKIFRRRVRA
jgi:hypothetical protein